jgi:hypothetical protein
MNPAPPAGGLGGVPPPGGPIGYYTPPAGGGARPATILWFRVYAIASALAVLAFLLVWQFLAPRPSAGDVLGALGLSLPFLVVYGIGALVPYKPWGWTYALIVIGLGMLGCLAPFSVVLVILWTRPEVKAAFGRL